MWECVVMTNSSLPYGHMIIPPHHAGGYPGGVLRVLRQRLGPLISFNTVKLY